MPLIHDAWRICGVPGSGIGAWDVTHVEFYTDEACTPKSRVFGGTPIDSGHWAERFNESRAFDQSDSSYWGGQKDADGRMWIGMHFPMRHDIKCVRYYPHEKHKAEYIQNVQVERAEVRGDGTRENTQLLWSSVNFEIVPDAKPVGWTVLLYRDVCAQRYSSNKDRLTILEQKVQTDIVSDQRCRKSTRDIGEHN